MTKPTLLVAIVAMLAFPLAASAQFSPRAGTAGGAEISAFVAGRALTPGTPAPDPRCTPAAPGLGLSGALGLPVGCVVPGQPTAPDPSIERSMPPGDIVFGTAFQSPSTPEPTGAVSVSGPVVVDSVLVAPTPAAVVTPSVEATVVLPTPPSVVVTTPSVDATIRPPAPAPTMSNTTTVVVTPRAPSPPPMSWPSASAETEPATASVVVVTPRAPARPVNTVPVAVPTVHVQADAPTQTAVVVRPKVPTAGPEVCPWTGTVTVARRSPPPADTPATSSSGSSRGTSFSFSASASFSIGG